LTIGHLSEDWQWIQNIKGKGNKSRNIPINKEFRRCILRYMDWRKQYPSGPEYPLLCSSNSAKKTKPDSWRLDGKTIYRIVNESLIQVTTKDLAHPHTLRHTFARRSLAVIGSKIGNATKALTMVKEMLGHSSIDTTMIYLNNDKNEISQLMEDYA
jgi:integrase/recombinase XerD